MVPRRDIVFCQKLWNGLSGIGSELVPPQLWRLARRQHCYWERCYQLHNRCASNTELNAVIIFFFLSRCTDARLRLGVEVVPDEDIAVTTWKQLPLGSETLGSEIHTRSELLGMPRKRQPYRLISRNSRRKLQKNRV